MRSAAGEYDLPMRLLTPGSAVNAMNEPLADTFTDSGRLWCAREAIGGSEGVADDHETARRRWRLRCHYRAGIDESCRLKLTRAGTETTYTLTSVMPSADFRELVMEAEEIGVKAVS